MNLAENQGSVSKEERRLGIRGQMEVFVTGMYFLFVRLLNKIAGGH